MKKILLFTLTLGLISPLYADNAKRQEIETHIQNVKNTLNEITGKAAAIMREESNRFSIIPLLQQQKIQKDIENAIEKEHDYMEITKQIKTCEDRLKTANNDGQLETLSMEVTIIDKGKILEIFKNQSIRMIKTKLENTLRQECCPKAPLTSQQWTDLKRDGHTTLTINGQERGFYMVEEDTGNFPRTVQALEWRHLMKSIPKPILNGNLINPDTFICQYQYRSSITRKDFIIRIWSRI